AAGNRGPLEDGAAGAGQGGTEGPGGIQTVEDAVGGAVAEGGHGQGEKFLGVHLPVAVAARSLGGKLAVVKCLVRQRGNVNGFGQAAEHLDQIDDPFEAVFGPGGLAVSARVEPGGVVVHGLGGEEGFARGERGEAGLAPGRG
ncbi:hypothetical protein RZS08_14480, partial [Arthrospira platensis SPKY1]|nr:hypothetical protein [Arthrospira platensis SPKY1]